MSFNYLLQTEGETRIQTNRQLRGWIFKYPKSADLFFQADYFTGKTESPGSPQGAFHAFAHHQLLRYPYTLRAAALLLELLARGIQTCDIISEGKCRMHVLTPWSIIRESKITYPPEPEGLSAAGS